MAIFSSGTGTPGGIPEFSLQSDQNAAANLLRNSMGIVNNLDVLIFTEIDRNALWKYDASSSRPTLHPLEHLRVDVSPSRVDESWKQILQDLVNDLPTDVKTAYEQNLLLPPAEQNLSLIALGKLLEGTAKALNWTQNSVTALDPNNPAAGPGSEIEARRIQNMALSNNTMQGIVLNSNTTFQSIRNELLNIDSNNPHFDSLVGTLNQIGMAYTTIMDLNNPSEEG